MKECVASGVTLPEAYHDALWQLYQAGDKVECPDYCTSQIEVAMTMFVESPLAEPMISRMFYGGFHELEQYRQEFLDGILDFEIEQGKWSYTYHSRIASQIPFVIQELKRNPYSRRAVIDVRDWEHDTESENPACLQNIQFLVRRGAVDCSVLFRSNDACKAAFMNAFALIMLQKRVADALGLNVGTYTHRANSFHCYEKDEPLLSGYVDRILSGNNTTYFYKGEWDALMEGERESIEEMVEDLKQRGAGR